MRHSAKNTSSAGFSRVCCKACGLYYIPYDGFRGTCLSCLKWPLPEDEDDGYFFHPPVPQPLSPVEIQLDHRLKRAELAVYYLHEALSRLAGPRLPARHEAESAITIFATQFPEYG